MIVTLVTILHRFCCGNLNVLYISLLTSAGPIGPAGLPGQAGMPLCFLFFAPQRQLLKLYILLSESHRCCILFVFIGPKGDRGYKGDQGEPGITVRTTESISSTRSESECLFYSFSITRTVFRGEK